MNDKIIIRKANQHNLKNVSLELPKNELIVFTGISGSGKSSLASAASASSSDAAAFSINGRNLRASSTRVPN